MNKQGGRQRGQPKGYRSGRRRLQRFTDCKSCRFRYTDRQQWKCPNCEELTGEFPF